VDVVETLLTDIIPYARNPRVNAQAVAKVAASIKEFSFAQPIVVDEFNVVIVGHTRLLAAQQLKMETVPVYVARNLSPAQAKAYRIMDNRSGEGAEWDFSLLSGELEDLVGLDFDLDLTGFDDSFIISVEEVNYPALADGEKEPFQQKTFTLHDEQADMVDDAVTLARTNPLADTGLNENTNGNALSFICGEWLECQQQKTSSSNR